MYGKMVHKELTFLLAHPKSLTHFNTHKQNARVVRDLFFVKLLARLQDYSVIV